MAVFSESPLLVFNSNSRSECLRCPQWKSWRIFLAKTTVGTTADTGEFERLTRRRSDQRHAGEERGGPVPDLVEIIVTGKIIAIDRPRGGLGAVGHLLDSVAHHADACLEQVRQSLLPDRVRIRIWENCW